MNAHQTQTHGKTKKQGPRIIEQTDVRESEHDLLPPVGNLGGVPPEPVKKERKPRTPRTHVDQLVALEKSFRTHVEKLELAEASALAQLNTVRGQLVEARKPLERIRYVLSTDDATAAESLQAATPPEPLVPAVPESVPEAARPEEPDPNNQ